MKKFIALCLFVFSGSNAQQHYNFDVELKYEYQDRKDPKDNFTYILYSNSRFNHFFARYEESNKRKTKFFFLDQNGKYYSKKTKTEDLAKSVIILDCEFTSRYTNPYKYQIENYDFGDIRDTIIDSQPLKMCWLTLTEKQIKK